MRPARHPSVAAPLRVLAGLLVLLAARPAPARASTIFQWAAAVSGNADDPSKWNPNGVPGFADYVLFNQTGSSYQVVFPGTVPQTFEHIYSAGNVTISMTSPHTTSGFYVTGSGVSSVTMNEGALASSWFRIGQAGQFSKLTLTNAGLAGVASVHSNSVFNSGDGGGDRIGVDGISVFNVLGGSQFYSDKLNTSYQNLEFGVNSTAACTTYVAGRSSQTFQNSGIHQTGAGTTYVGVFGYANLVVYNGGFMDASGDIIVGRYPGSRGFITTGPTSIGTSFLTARANLLVGNNAPEFQAGSGTLTVNDRSFVTVGGTCAVGDPDGDDGSLLRMMGGSLTAAGGLHIWASPGAGALDLRGGITHVHGGTFVYPAGRLLTVSSQVGQPQLWIANGAASPGLNSGSPAVSALMVGRGGYGLMRVSGAGTSFPITGAITLGDSLGGTGTLVVDSTASMPVNGTLVVGSHGTGEFDVLNLSTSNATTTYIGASGGSNGKIRVAGETQTLASRFSMIDNLYIGGALGGPGGTGRFEADSGGIVVVNPSQGNPNPALVTVYAGTGSLYVGFDALFRAGIVADYGSTVLDGGQIDGLTETVVEPGGTMSGWGWVNLGVFLNSGVVAPSRGGTPFGSITMPYGTFLQTSAGRYQVTLGSGRRCDTLVVHNTATIGGRLDLQLDGSFVRTPGDTFTVLTCDSLAGTYATVTWNGNPLSGQAQIVYQHTRVLVVIGSASAGVEGGAAPSALRFAAAGPVTALRFVLDLPEAAAVQVKLYDVRGAQVATLADGMRSAGRHALALPAGRALPSGAYFAKAAVTVRGVRWERTARAVLVR